MGSKYEQYEYLAGHNPPPKRVERSRGATLKIGQSRSRSAAELAAAVLRLFRCSSLLGSRALSFEPHAPRGRRSRMMMGQEGTCWEERIHKEEDALQDFMEEWDTGLPNDIAQMEERQRQEAQSRAETAQSRLSDFAAQQKPENAQGRLSRVRWPPRSIARAGSAPFRAADPRACVRAATMEQDGADVRRRRDARRHVGSLRDERVGARRRGRAV